MVLSDREIINLAQTENMISPFEAGQISRVLPTPTNPIETPSNGRANGRDRRGRFRPTKATEHTPESIARMPPDRKVISYGTSSYGYDVRLADEFRIFTNVNSTLVDPKRFDEDSFVEVEAQTNERGEASVIIPPNSFVLARSLEWFQIPRDVLVICLGKSTYARCGIIVNVTPLEPEWCGHITIEISNTAPLPARIYAREGIAQLLFLKGSRPCQRSYGDKQGKYQDQHGITPPKA